MAAHKCERAGCGRSFDQKKKSQRYCSKACRKAAENERLRKGDTKAEAGSKPAPGVKSFTVIEGGIGGVPEPDWSTIFNDELDIEFAQRQWRAIVTDLKDSEKLATVNVHQLKRLVISYVLYDLAAHRVIEQGAVIKAKKTSVPQYNPWWSILKDANSMATTHEAELTLSPRRRNNGGKVKQRSPSASAASAYLRPIPK